MIQQIRQLLANASRRKEQQEEDLRVQKEMEAEMKAELEAMQEAIIDTATKKLNGLLKEKAFNEMISCLRGNYDVRLAFHIRHEVTKLPRTHKHRQALDVWSTNLSEMAIAK